MNISLQEEKNQTKSCGSNFLASDTITHLSILTKRTSIKLAVNEVTGIIFNVVRFISQFPPNQLTVFLLFIKVG